MAAYYQEKYSCCQHEGHYVPVLSSFPLYTKNENFTSVIIAIHGLNENAGGTFNDVTNGAHTVGLEHTLVVVPWFHTSAAGYQWGEVSTDVNKSQLGARWMGNASWISAGDPYETNNLAPDTTLSSYDILDSFFEHFTQRSLYPALRRVSYVGFSAGGQMINRYAWASKLGRTLTSNSNSNSDSSDDDSAAADVQFIISDASSYLYFTSERPSVACRGSYDTGPSHTCAAFTPYYTLNERPRPYAPQIIANISSSSSAAEYTPCKEFDTWKFGTTNMPGAAQGFSYLQPFLDDPSLNDEHTYWYSRKNVKHLFGSWDSCNCKATDYTNPEHCAPLRPDGSYVSCAPLMSSTGSDGVVSTPNCCDTYPDAVNNDLATSCGSNLQGSNRLQRGLNYVSYLQRYYTSSEFARIQALYETATSSEHPATSHSIEYAVVEGLQHDSPTFYTSDIVQRWLYILPNTTSTAPIDLPTMPDNFPIPLPLPLLDFSNVAFLAIYVAMCLAVGVAISLVLRYHSQQRRRWPTAIGGTTPTQAQTEAAANEETYLLL